MRRPKTEKILAEVARATEELLHFFEDIVLHEVHPVEAILKSGLRI